MYSLQSGFPRGQPRSGVTHQGRFATTSTRPMVAVTIANAVTVHPMNLQSWSPCPAAPAARASPYGCKRHPPAYRCERPQPYLTPLSTCLADSQATWGKCPPRLGVGVMRTAWETRIGAVEIRLISFHPKDRAWGRRDLNPDRRVSPTRGATHACSANHGSALQSVITGIQQTRSQSSP